MEDPLHGYSGSLRRVLEGLGVKIGDRIRVSSRGRTYEGILMPRYAMAGKSIIVVKLDNGYNVGVRFEPGTVVERVEGAPRKAGRGMLSADIVFPKPRPRPEAPLVHVISTGGTIASRIEYETGAVKPALTSEDLVHVVPEISEYARIEAEILYSVFSEDMNPKLWEGIVDSVAAAFRRGARGVVVTHGTDTMGYTAAALSFAFRSLPGPVVLVGSQRSSDRPSSDAAFNLRAAVLAAARAPFAEVVVVMHGETGDTYALAHRGTKVRKMHTSRRDAFQSINSLPLARIYPDDARIDVVVEEYRRPGSLAVENGFEEKVALVKMYPGIRGDIIDYIVDSGYKGIVLEGSGLGHFPNSTVDSIKRAVDSGVVVVMTSQCLFGRVNMNVYSTGRRLLSAGVIPGGDMLPETAYAKLSWVLAHARSTEEAERLMLENLAGEYNPRHGLELYPRWNHG